MFSKLSVIIVEDEPELLENLMIGLSGKGFQVCGTNSGTVLNQMLSEQQADIIVLDIGLPGEDGISIARRVQQTHPSCGIIMVTAHGATHDITNGLQNGADNYFVKPVNIEVLAMSIRSLARRLNKTNKTAWVLHCESSSLRTPRGIKVNLTALECILLKRLMGQTGTNVHRSEILAELGLPDDINSYPRLEVMISRLRSKVTKADPAATLPVKARHNIGYVFLHED